MYAGIDAGASATKAVIVNEKGEIISYAIMPSGVNFKLSSKKVLEKALQSSELKIKDVSYIVSTGYGRSLVDAQSSSSEIACISRGLINSFHQQKQ